jgi:hypothetical protein
MIFVVRLFPPPTVTNDGILSAKRASPQDAIRPIPGPIGFEVVLRSGK